MKAAIRRHTFALVAGVLAGAAGGLIAVLVDQLRDEGLDLEDVARAATALGVIVTGTIGVVALWFARQQIGDNRRTAKVARTVELLRSYNIPRFIEIIHKAMEFADVPEGKRDETWAKWESDAEARHPVAMLWNFFETVGLMYNRDLLDREVAHQVFAELSSVYWERTGWLIERARESDPPWGGPIEWIGMENSFRNLSGAPPIPSG